MYACNTFFYAFHTSVSYTRWSMPHRWQELHEPSAWFNKRSRGGAKCRSRRLPLLKFASCRTSRELTTGVMSSAQRNKTETEQFQNSFKTVLKLFCFSFI